MRMRIPVERLAGRRARGPAAAAGLALLLASILPGCAPAPKVRAIDAWIRPVAVGQMTAAYFTLVNDSADSVTLVRVGIPAVETAMMHETVEIEGRMAMREVERFTVAPHARLVFRPGGNHVMAMQARVALAEGGTTGMDLTLADGRTLHVTARVRS